VYSRSSSPARSLQTFDRTALPCPQPRICAVIHGQLSISSLHLDRQWRFALTRPSSKVEDALLSALSRLVQSPDLSPEEKDWVRQLVLHLMAELSTLTSEGDDDAEAA
jgi:hypothetical protein